jgi:hypothetical protein
MDNRIDFETRCEAISVFNSQMEDLGGIVDALVIDGLINVREKLSNMLPYARKIVNNYDPKKEISLCLDIIYELSLSNVQLYLQNVSIVMGNKNMESKLISEKNKLTEQGSQYFFSMFCSIEDLNNHSTETKENVKKSFLGALDTVEYFLKEKIILNKNN